MKNQRIKHTVSAIPARVIPHPAVESPRQVDDHPGRIAIPSSAGTHFIRICDIMYCQAESNYCRLFFASGEQFLVSQTLKRISAQLPYDRFLRVHAKYLVAASEVEFLGMDHLILSGKQHIPVARSRRQEVVRRLT
jgi:two-component system LytT family response regulator